MSKKVVQIKPIALSEYPAAIMTVDKRLLELQQKLRVVEAALQEQDFAVETAIAFNPELKNEAQRKAAKMDLQQTAEYKTAVKQCREVQDQITEAEIELRFLRNCFTVAKLEAEQAMSRNIA